ncbi:hypothetical protein Pflav_068370 [Phytohabitans flavus]|uniref:RND efflux pump membrane fusion protein barrel-sandwich domain-containing protein n=1 Tax=Phytohabitans flavus TaxID=1076124 RepID=A0A6F8Y2Z7_9ACTN|nr:hypothetical protein Pflav_068370 [Phytohabitans flavus]
MRTAGTVAEVGTVAVAKEDKTTVEVTVTVADQKALGTLDQAPVDVILESDKRENVLTVPLNALVALAEGGYGLQVVEGGTTRYVAVETGMFAGGKVEVSGDGLAEGMVVGFPRDSALLGVQGLSRRRGRAARRVALDRRRRACRDRRTLRVREIHHAQPDRHPRPPVLRHGQHRRVRGIRALRP